MEKLTRKGLSAFLAEHEECGGGFEVRRQAGSTGSIVRVICGGCGESAEYPAASDEGLIVDQPPSRSSSRRIGRKRDEERSRPPREERPRAGSSPPKDGAPRRRAQASSSINWRSWLPGAIAGLIGGALVLIVLAIASGGGSDKSSSSGQSANTKTPAATVATAPATTTQTPSPRRRSRESRLASNLDQRQLAERVSIGVPRGWSAGVSGGAVTLSAQNGRAEVQVYYEPGAKSQADLVNGSKRFLLQRHPGAHLEPVESTDAGGRQARTVRVTYPGGTESATVLVAGGYSYLILVRLGKPSSAEARRTAEAVTMSFRPI